MSEQVLIIDDEKAIVETLVDTFNLRKISVRGETDAQKAIDGFRANPTDVVVVDYRLSGRLTGVGVIEQLRSFKPYTQFILISGWIDEDLDEETLTDELRKISLANHYLPKPVDPDKLVLLVQDALQSVEDMTGDWKTLAKRYAEGSNVTHDQVRKLNERIKSHLIPAVDETHEEDS